MKKMFGVLFSILVSIITISDFSIAQDTLYVYGPGGPAPAMNEAANIFEKQSGIKVIITSGPTPKWIEGAKKNADIIFSGSETMMTDFVVELGGLINELDVMPMYLRPLSMLVRPGNPQKIKGVNDIFVPGIKVLVVNGAGQNGVWEDMAGRKGDINTVKKLRKNIVGYAKNSAEARQLWIEKPEIDVWLIWNIWQVSNPKLAEVVSIETEYAIYRDTGIVLTKKGKTKNSAQKFIDFLISPDGAKIFNKWGWIS